MRPPQYVSKGLEKLSPRIRLGWLGGRRAGMPRSGERKFALLNLVPRRMVNKMISLRWNNADPVFGTKYDTNQYVAFVAEWVEPECVFDGSVLFLARAILGSAKERLRKENQRLQKERRSQIRDTAEEIGEEVHRNAQRDTYVAPTVANKFLTKDDKAKLDGSWKQDVKESALGAL